MRRWGRRLLIVAAVVLVGLALRATVFAPEPVPVEVVTVAAGRVEQTVTNSRAGTVRARRRAKLSPEFGGLVSALPFREGKRVRKGDVVLRLDDRLQRSEVAVARRERDAAAAQREQACLAAEQAARELARIGRLAEDQIASRDQLDRVQTEAEASAARCQAARAAVERAEAAVTLAETRLEKAVLRAPFDAVVAQLSTEIGEWVTPSPPGLPIPPVMDVFDPSSLYISAPMDEVDSARIAVGQRTRVSVDSHPGEHFPGRVTRVAPFVLDVEAQNRTVEIEVELDDSELAGSLLPGTSADVEVILSERQDVLRVPTAAVLQGSQVLVVENNTLSARPVRIGLRNWDFSEVAEGLQSGEQVVVSVDRPEVQAGARVEVTQKPPAP
jgi:HlyD family secretion protein